MMSEIQLYAIFTVLIAISAIDLKRRIIPDILVVLIIAMSLPYTNWPLGLGMGITSYILKWALEHLLKRPALGFGDVKLLAALGCCMPITALPVFLIATGFGGIVFSIIWQQRTFPFAPAITIGYLAIFFF
ncbi:MAG: prepilin peptidase [Alphaproteobacteria bacterium]